MIRRLLLTGSTAAWLVGLYLMYARFVSPIVESTQLAASAPGVAASTVTAVEEDARPSDLESVAAEHLPQHDWVREAANSFRIGDMYLYANSFKQEDGGDQEGQGAEIRFEPFALVWKHPEAAPGAPPRLRITADAAVIKFEHKFDFTTRNQGRPVFGSLQGKVEIEGPNGLRIVGRGFTFEEKALKLWCDSDVKFHYGPHHGTGHGLQVDFLPSDDRLVSLDQPRLGGIRNVSLLREVKLHLLGEEPAADGGRRSPLKAGDRLDLSSAGRMQYDMEANLITFDQRVEIRHPGANNAQEGMNCDLLTLVLSQIANANLTPPGTSPSGTSPSGTTPRGQEIALAANEVPATHPASPADWLPKRLNLEKMLADGTGKRRIEIFSPHRDLHCNAAQVEYDLPRRHVVLRDPVNVDVLQGQHQLHAPEISLTLHENNRDVLQAVARGKGTASSRLPDGRTLNASWNKQLVKSTDPRTMWDIVELQGAANINLQEEYGLSGDALRLYVSGLPGAATEGSHKAAKPAQSGIEPQLERLSGVGKVVLNSPQATATTQKLDVTFQSVALPAQTGTGEPTLLGLNQSAPPSRAGARARNPRKPSTKPLDLQADALNALIHRDLVNPQRMDLAELWADDNVVITQPMKPDEPPLTIEGQHLHIANQPLKKQIVTVTGSPAQIKSGQSRLEGADIQLDRIKNTLKVLSAGVLQQPVNMGLNGQKLDRMQVLRVKWAEKLEFDGETADFYERVEASLQHTVMRCNAMHVSLQTPIRFDDPNLRSMTAERIQLARVSCENKVELESAEYLGNIIISRSFGQLGQFVIDNLTGKTEAHGPGHFEEWRRGQSGPEPRGNGKAARPLLPAAKSHDWTYSRIDFQGLMKGNIHERFTTFEDHVEIIYGPVQHATDLIDPDELPEGAASITCDALKVEQFSERPGAPASIKLLAEGNTRLEMEYDHHPISAQADEVKFDEAKDFYLLRSIGGQKVIINREPTTADPRGRIVCSRVAIYRGHQNRSPREIKFSNLTELNGVQ